MSNSIRVTALAEELYGWVWEKTGRNAPTRDEVESFLTEQLEKMSLQIAAKDAATETTKIAALLKKPANEASKRMRELAGIPHQGNFT